MKSEFRCSAAAMAACPLRDACAEDAYFYEGSECHQFNEEVADRLKKSKRQKQATSECTYCLDEFCVNAECPMCADYCPVPDTPGVCRYEDRGRKDHGTTEKT